MATSPENIQCTRQVYMWLMASMYLFAFASLYTQIPGLYGPTGLTPVHNVLPPTSQGDQSLLDRFLSFPSLLIFHDVIHLLPHVAMELCCAAGAVLAILAMVFQGMRCSFIFLLLWLLYLSLHKVGQVFLWFQWDSLLLEAGFITVLVAPFNLIFWRKVPARPHDGLTLWLVRWLLFRLMFASGIVKLTSQCPTWWGLTALNYHYESQCIPTPLSWYAHQLPEWVQKMSVVSTYFIEIAAPLLFFVPVRSLRMVGFWTQVFLQVMIVLTGNYNFFNLLTITLCVSLLDDEFFGGKSHETSSSHLSISRRLCRVLFGSLGDSVHALGRFLIFLTVMGYLLALTVYWFDIRVDLENWTLLSRINFTQDSFLFGLSVAVPVLAVVGAVSLAVEVVSAVISSLKQPGVMGKFSSLLQTCLFTTVVAIMFSVSLVSHGVLDGNFYTSIPQNVMKLHGSMNEFSVTSPYGLFRRMTGVGGRPELIIEGSNDLDDGEWQEYDFIYKPGKVTQAPLFVAPHQPRLDWQMWFGALGSYEHNPWMVHLVYRLLIGQKEVLQLMGPPPFKTPPSYIRARLYDYHYTAYDTKRSFFNQTQSWWWRELKKEYLFALTRDNSQLQEFLSRHRYLVQPEAEVSPSFLSGVLTTVRKYTDQFTPPTVLWALFISATLATITMSFLLPDKDKHRFTAGPIPLEEQPDGGNHQLPPDRTDAGLRSRHSGETRRTS